MALSSLFIWQTPQTFNSDQLLLDDPLCCFDDYTAITGSFVDPWSALFSCPKPELAVEMLTPLPDFKTSKIQSGEFNLKETGERGVSAQSIAARERRKKITEKTQELGRLIPGGTKMNTVEMLQAAFKYVKYLQAQLGILQMMEPFEKSEDLKSLLSSPLVEEKLYMEDKCLATWEFVLFISNEHDEEFKSTVYEELSRLFTPDP